MTVFVCRGGRSVDEDRGTHGIVERPPPRAVQELAEPRIGQLSIRDPDLAAQLSGCRLLRIEPAIDLRVHPTDEERRDRRETIDRLAGTAPRFERAQMRLRDLLVMLDGEEQRG